MAVSQTDITRAIGTTQSAISRIEMGEENITVLTLFRIAKAFKKKLDIRFLEENTL